MTIYSSFEEVVELLVLLEPKAFKPSVRDVCSKLTDEVKEQLLVAASSLSSDALSFAFKYTMYYVYTREENILPDQFKWSTKYAIVIAPLVATLLPNQRFNPDFAGKTVEYSWASIRINFQSDPDTYDINVLYGAVIMKMLNQHDVPVTITREIGESWQTVVEHWHHLEGKKAAYVQSFVRNLKTGGSISLSSGLL